MATTNATTQVTESATETVVLSNDERTRLNDTAVADIVGMCVAMYEDEGERSFAIGKRFFEHAQWQRGNFPGKYEQGDFVKAANRIRDEVRMLVQIKESSIQVASWARCYVLRECVRTNAGDDVADSLSLYEYICLIGKGLHFDVPNLTGEIKPGWLDMIKTVAHDRGQPDGRVTSEDFRNRIVATELSVAAAKMAALDPAVAAAKVASDAVKATAAKRAKAIKDVTDSINDNVACGAITTEGALAILEGVAVKHGKPLVAASIGFDPVNATVTECETMIAAMFSAGRLIELRAIVAKASKAVATLEKAAGKASKPEKAAAAA